MSYLGNETFLLLGGGGMVGQEIAFEIARKLNPNRIIVCSLSEPEARRTAEKIKRDFVDVDVLPVAGDVFVRHGWNPSSGDTRSHGVSDEVIREGRYTDTFDRIELAYDESELVWLIKTYKPDVIIDSVNTATGISYQDVYTATAIAHEKLSALKKIFPTGETDSGAGDHDLVRDSLPAFETVLINQSIPQLVRHVLLINRAMREMKTRLYLKVGTTGTGGMGLNIPYTHSEDSPSATLMEKTAVAFAHTGLLYLMARTLDGPVVKEFKPAAMIGYSDIARQKINVKRNGKVGVPGETFKLYSSRSEVLESAGELCVRESPNEHYDVLGDLEFPVVNTGENGRFTRGEFQAITAMRQMEFITPEEIARQAVLEVKGSNTGYDVIAAIDGASMNPTYRAGYLRSFALDYLMQLEGGDQYPSVALGDLGPPELGKLLWEAYLLHRVYRRKNRDDNELSRVRQKSAAELAAEVSAFLDHVDQEKLRNTIVSVGFPIRYPDGKTIVRGPYIRIPERKDRNTLPYTMGNIEDWAAKGWVDLCEPNMERWRKRFEEMQHQTRALADRGSAAFTREAYLSSEIRIGVVVAWIFNNECDERGRIKFGYRIK